MHIERKNVFTIFCISVFVVTALLNTSCNNDNDAEYNIAEHTPAYVDPATIQLAKYREAGDIVSYKKHLDSIYVLFHSRSLADKFYVWYLYADSYGRIGDVDNALAYVDSTIDLLENNPPENFSRNNYLWVYYFKADFQLRKGNIDEAYNNYYKALSFADKYHDTCAVGYYYLKIGLLMFEAKQYKDAGNFFNTAYNYCLTCDNNFGYFFRTQQLLNDIGLTYERREMYDSAVHYYQTGLSLIESKRDEWPENRQNNMQAAIGILYGNLAGTYMALGDYEKAESSIQNAYRIDGYVNSAPLDYRFTKLKHAKLLLSTNKANEAKRVLDEVKVFADSVQNIQLSARLNKLCWQYWDMKKNTTLAYQYLNNYKQLEDSLNDLGFKFSLVSLDNNVQSIRKEFRISSLERDAKTRRLYLLALSVIAIFAVVIITQIITSLRRSKRYIQQLTLVNSKVKKQRLELEQADEEKDRILKAVSHDMRSPVNSLLALVDLLESDAESLSEEQKEYVALMKKSGENALTLTKDLLEAATLNAEKLEKQPTDITTELNARIKLLQFKAADKNQKIIFNAPANHITASVNIEKLLRVIANLISNAIKFSPEESTIVVTLSTYDNLFKVEVKDSGIGIPNSMKEKVFDIFSEAKRFGTSGEQPYGLGLSISKQIVEAHNGKIWFDSKEGKGTSFYIEVPV